MTVSTARNWLGIFFLGTTACLGAYILLFQQTKLLPIATKDATSSFQIIIPTLVAQLTLAFKWIADPPSNRDEELTLPMWAVAGPPAAVVLIMLCTIILIAVDGGNSLEGGALFKNAVTFCVTLLSATTIIIMARVFARPGRTDRRRRNNASTSRHAKE
jgi:hypothetical protein